MEFAVQIFLVLLCLFYGAKKGGVALGLLGGLGLAILTFVFKIPPGKPPVDVMLTILAVVTASATLQASGGLDVLLQIAERMLRKHPKMISIEAPLVCTMLTMICGTGHVVYTMLPIIYDVAIKNGIRPERPMAASSVAAQMGIIASPVSVAVGSLVAMLALSPFGGQEITYTGLLSITIPSTLIGVCMIGLFSWKRGKDLEKDADFQKFISTPENKAYVYGDVESLISKTLPKSSWAAMWIFIATIGVVGLLGAFEQLRPEIGKPAPAKTVTSTVQNATNPLQTNASITAPAAAQSVTAATQATASATQDSAIATPAKEGKAEAKPAKAPAKPKRVSMVHCIQMFMLVAGALILLTTHTNAAAIAKNDVFRAGMVAIVAVFGIAWMADTIFDAHLEELKLVLPKLVEKTPWAYAIILLIVSKFVNSQATALAAFVPVALKAGVDPGIIVAFAPACYGYFILPTYPSDLAAINFDRSGTTKIGKFVINHSFILPGLIGVVTSCIVGYILATAYGYL